MKDLLEHADLSRYAGQFVWLELNYDTPGNRPFMTQFGAMATPTFYVIDPQGERVTATQTGAMSLTELQQFLERGRSAMLAKSQTPADAALVRGDGLLTEHPADAVKAYQDALHLAPAGWPRHDLAVASEVQALQDSNQLEPCADLAASEAAHMKRDDLFTRTVVAGMWCVAGADPTPWANADLAKLQPMAEEALKLPTTVRDHRDAIYRTLMNISVARNDKTAAGKWGDRWLAELDAIKPTNDDQRSALDIARVENIQVYGDAERILPALRDSERLMPNSYIASLRLAQVELDAEHYDEAIAACNRGLARNPGASGRAWILQIKASAFTMEGKSVEAREALQKALEAAQEIPTNMRNMTIENISKKLKAAGG